MLNSKFYKLRWECKKNSLAAPRYCLSS